MSPSALGPLVVELLTQQLMNIAFQRRTDLALSALRILAEQDRTMSRSELASLEETSWMPAPLPSLDGPDGDRETPTSRSSIVGLGLKWSFHRSTQV